MRKTIINCMLLLAILLIIGVYGLDGGTWQFWAVAFLHTATVVNCDSAKDGEGE